MLDPAHLNHPFSGALLLCYENDRPLHGMIADLDWRFNGHFSALMKQQLLTGAPGEVVYSPLKWNETTLHFLILGGGFLESEKDRSALSRALFETALQKFDELKLPALTVSQTDWNISENHPGIKERGLWLVI
jgi:hypothetical protein